MEGGPARQLAVQLEEEEELQPPSDGIMKRGGKTKQQPQNLPVLQLSHMNNEWISFFFFAFTIHCHDVGKHRARQLPCWRGEGRDGERERKDCPSDSFLTYSRRHRNGDGNCESRSPHDEQ